MPTLVLRGQYDGIAAFDDLIEFFKRLPNPDKQFSVMAGISHASFQQKNYLTVYHILHAFFTQPAAGLRRHVNRHQGWSRFPLHPLRADRP